ncbi:MAG: hypothetical protein VXW65_13685 [Pseudomonadota bacterium]|nr:hypothetical protein [Pseudomonadota bacterium]
MSDFKPQSPHATPSPAPTASNSRTDVLDDIEPSLGLPSDTPDSLVPPIESQRLHPIATRPSPIQWSPEQRAPKVWRPKPLKIGMALLLVGAGLTIVLPGIWFSFGAFLVHAGLVFWLVALLRQGLNQPVGRFLLPMGLLFLLLGIDQLTLTDIPVLGILVVVFGGWLLWQQFKPK